MGRNANAFWNYLPAFAGALAILAAPVTVDWPTESDGGFGMAWKVAHAGSSNGGGNGGGNSGGKDKGNNGKSDQAKAGTAGAASVTGPGRAPDGGMVAMAQFTTGLSHRRPADEVNSVENADNPISFYTQVHNMAGQTVTHRWMYGGEVRYEVVFEIMADNWRFWSKQILPRELAGKWTVELVNQNNEVMESRTLDYRPAG